MYPVSQKFNDYSFARDRRMLVKVTIGDKDYTGENDVIGFEINSSVTNTEDFVIGAATASELILELRTEDVVPPNAKILPFIAFGGSQGDSEWLPMGEFYVDNRRYNRGVWTFNCLDKLVFADVPFLSQLSYPATMKAVWEEAISITGFSVDGSIHINDSYTIPAGPAGFTIRQVMAYIAGCHGASIYAGKDGKICWRQYSAAETADVELGPSIHSRAVESNPVRTYTRIVGIKDGETFEAGSGSDVETLTINNPFLTQTIVDDLLTVLDGFNYQPIVMSGFGIPQLNVGDRIGYGGSADTLVLNITWRFHGGMSMQLDAPSKSEQKSEFGFDASFAGQINSLANRAVLLGNAYYGISFSRERGLEQLREDGEGRAEWNADTLTFQRSDGNGGWVDVLYFDAAQKTMVFDGKLSTQLIEALEAQFGTTITNILITNTLVADKGYIAELTVDQLETSDKVQRYLAGNTTDVNYIRIEGQKAEWLTESTTGTIDEQAYDRQGNPLYWKDEEKKAVTTEVTEWPVMQYVYETKLTKAQISFEKDGDDYIPVIQMGAGIDDLSNRGKAFIRKVDGGLHIEYHRENNGELRSIKIDERGIWQEGNANGYGLRNIHVGPTPPPNPQINDLWINTNA